MIDKIFPKFKTKFREIDDPNRIFLRNSDFIKNSIIKQSMRKITGINLIAPLNRIFGNYPRGIDVNGNLFTIRISDGCSGNCSYCDIKKAIGPLKSKPMDEIMGETGKAISRRQFKINIISNDTGAYGIDIGTNIIELLKRILEQDKRITIEFIQDLHPAYIERYGDGFIELIHTKRIKSILSAVQSGNDRVIRLMKRPLNAENYKQTIHDFKKAYPGLGLKTQIIAGFPSETREEFQETLNYIAYTLI
jgi:tRNA A37 methylthiotransferase MiaB